jgi:hypothetical protein
MTWLEGLAVSARRGAFRPLRRKAAMSTHCAAALDLVGRLGLKSFYRGSSAQAQIRPPSEKLARCPPHRAALLSMLCLRTCATSTARSRGLLPAAPQARAAASLQVPPCRQVQAAEANRAQQPLRQLLRARAWLRTQAVCLHDVKCSLQAMPVMMLPPTQRATKERVQTLRHTRQATARRR